MNSIGKGDNMPKRYGSRGTIKQDKQDDTIANPNERELRARNQAMWGTEHMLHEFWKQNQVRGNKFWGYANSQDNSTKEK